LLRICRKKIRAKQKEKVNFLKTKKTERAYLRVKLKAYRADDPTSPTAAIHGGSAKQIHPLQVQVLE
jgi:hypothetical protein